MCVVCVCVCGVFIKKNWAQESGRECGVCVRVWGVCVCVCLCKQK